MTGADLEYRVLECSQVSTPAEFWRAYVSELPLEGGHMFGRNLNALWDALSAGGPGYPGPCLIEIRNIERLEDNGNEEFVSALERIAEDLKDANSDVELVVMHFRNAPRGRLYQHHNFRTKELSGTKVERLVVWESEIGMADMVFLKVENRLWQRLFLDAGAVFWEEWADADVFSGFEDTENQLRDLGTEMSLAGKTVGVVAVESRQNRCTLVIDFLDAGALCLWMEGIDGDSLFEYRDSA